MSFIDLDTLKQLTPSAWVDAFERNNPEVLEKRLLPAVDAIITRCTGKQPPETAATTDINIQIYALWLLKYLLCEYQSGLTTDEVEKRRRDYDRAVRELGDMQGTTVDQSYAVVASASVSAKRPGDWP